MFQWDYMINHKEDENYKKKSHIDTTLINLGLGIEYKHTKYKNCLSMMVPICTKQHLLSNIWSSIHEKVKQNWGWVEKKRSL